MLKKMIIIIVTVATLVGVGGYFIIQKLDKDVEMILTEDITEVNIADLNDGVYIGEYNKALAVSAKLRVTVEDGKIIDIEILEHKNGQGTPAEVIVENFIGEQSVLVDDIAGATYSSRVLKLALMDALGVSEDE